MSKIKDGGSAFPHSIIYANNESQFEVKQGLSMRDYLAAKAMQVTLSRNNNYPDENWRIGIAMDAYKMADAMLEVRENTMQTPPVAWWSGEPDTYILCNAEYQRHKDNENFDAIRHLKPLYAMREREE